MNNEGIGDDEGPSLSIVINKAKTRWRLFTQSILYFPILFSVGSILLFLLTSRLDTLYYQKVALNIPYLSPLIFAGSSDAARSILSTIAAGWATILGVAFSVSLITLQLSITKYTSHLVNRFEGDKVNQLTLGWFIAVVIYALLVLKTIRTSDGGGTANGSFTPVIGVNITVAMAIISLFLFVLFLRNISSYLRPNILIANVVKQIFLSLNSYEKRIPDKKAEYVKRTRHGRQLLEIRSNSEGVINNINWEIIYKALTDFSDPHQNQNQNQKHYKMNNNNNDDNSTNPSNYYCHDKLLPKKRIADDEKPKVTKDEKGLWMDFTKSIGENIRRNEILAVIYRYNDQQDSSSSDRSGSTHTSQALDNSDNDNSNNNSNNSNNANNDKSDDYLKDLELKNIKRYKHKILSGIEITQNRSYDKDPLFGIELLRSMAVKSEAMGDTDIVNSSITGLFKILRYALRNEERFGIPFHMRSAGWNGSETSKAQSSKDSYISCRTIIINPSEASLANTIMDELSIITNLAADEKHLPMITHSLYEYISLCHAVLELEPPRSGEVFARITDWFSKLLLYAYPKFPNHLKTQIATALIKFRDDLILLSPQASRIFRIYMKDIIDESANLNK